MSRLYNTLEKIRTSAPGEFSAEDSAPAKGLDRTAGKNGKRRLVLLGLGASALLTLALVVFLAGPARRQAGPPVPAGSAAPAQPAAPSAAEPAPRRPDSPQPPLAPAVSSQASPSGIGGNNQYRQLNDTGLALIRENQPWRGIYHLEQARRQQPARPEALINLAVALAEMGLTAPAKRFFREAHALAPNHPLLRKNLNLLAQADFLDSQWLSSLTAGSSGPGQPTRPQ